LLTSSPFELASCSSKLPSVHGHPALSYATRSIPIRQSDPIAPLNGYLPLPTFPKTEDMPMIDYPTILRQVALERTQYARRLEEHARLLERTPESKRDNVAHALAVLHPAYYSWWKGPIESVYPTAAPKYQARLILGMTPRQITGLHAAEAHQYLSGKWSRNGCSPASWLCVEAGIDCDSPRDVSSARWLIAVLSDPPRREALCRERIERLPNGTEIRGRYFDRTDELTARDLRPSVEATFRAAAERLWKRTERILAKDHLDLCAVPNWWRPLHCARLLLRAAELVVEGREMRHCVAQYSSLVKRGDCVIVALNVRGHRSTAELTRKGIVVQHKARDNQPPHLLCNKALLVLLRRCGLEEFPRP